MTHTHTESPWHLGTCVGNPAIYGKDGAEIAEIFQVLTPEWRANARLIAAAPELLAALRALCSHYPNPVQIGTGMADDVIAARAAIAKAEGSRA